VFPRSLLLAWLIFPLGLTGPARAEAPVPLDRAIVRFHAPETGGPKAPQFIFERELSFEARVEALSEGRATSSEPFLDRHVRAALERRIAEELLSRLPVDPEPAPSEIASLAEAVREVIEQRVGGRDKLIAAAAAEGIDSGELDSILRRKARATLYLDRMVTALLDPTDAELREVHRSAATPFRGRPFREIKDELRRWYIGQRVSAAITSFYQNARTRVQVTFLTK